jgi:hypothetical protein
MVATTESLIDNGAVETELPLGSESRHDGVAASALADVCNVLRVCENATRDTISL